MLTSTAKTDNPPTTTVISIGSDIGFSDAGMGGTTRGMTGGRAGGGVTAGERVSATVWSAGAGYGVAGAGDAD